MADNGLVEAPVFTVRRAEALQAYATIEYALAQLVCAILGKHDPHIGFSVISRMLNAKSRGQLIGDLSNTSVLLEIKPFWDRLSDRLSRLDRTRNKIVHWNLTYSETEAGKTYSLMPWSTFTGQKQDRLCLPDIEQFISSAYTCSSLISFYGSYQRGDDLWRSISRSTFLENLPPDEMLQKLGQKVAEAAQAGKR